jgi:hypothetical protein
VGVLAPHVVEILLSSSDTKPVAQAPQSRIQDEQLKMHRNGCDMGEEDEREEK